MQETKKKHTRLKILCSVLLILALLLGGNYVIGTTAICSYIKESVEPVTPHSGTHLSIGRDDADGFTTLTPESDRDIRVLHLTDLHFTGGYPSYFLDRAAVDAIYTLVKETRPDLIILNGDSISPIIFTGATGNSMKIAEAIGTLFEEIGIPWTLVYGNHDREGFAGLDEISAYFESLPHCVFSRGPAEIDGYGNHVLKILRPTGELRQVLFLLDSNGGTPLGYDHVHENQVAWYRETAAALKARHGDYTAAMYLHIPVEEYATLLEKAEAGDPTVEKLYGENRESVSYGKNYGLYSAVAESGGVRYMFFGHDHVNSIGLRDNTTGITMSFSLSIDYSAYPFTKFQSSQRGGNLLTLHADGEMNFALVPIDGIR